jgi:DNA transposition AAA+ family ATPase
MRRIAYDWTATLRGPDKMPGFIATREHRRFVEFAGAVRRQRTIGLCYGPAGVGKTWSARRYAHWHRIEPFILEWGPRDPSDARIHALAARSRTVFYTPAVGAGLKQMKDDLNDLAVHMGFCISAGLALKDPSVDPMRITPMELLIVDEAERLNVNALEWLRDLYDRAPMGLILTGMPGIEKSLARYAQLYSRVGFAHEYRPLQGEELTFVLRRHWKTLGLALDADDFTDDRAIAAVVRITGGNFRLLQRLFNQIGRILAVNEMTTITEDVVDAARSTLVIGAT